MTNNNNNNVNEIKNNFVKWYNNNCYKYYTVNNCNTFEDCINDIEIDDYETIIEEFSDFFGYNCYYIYDIFSN